MDEWGVDGAVTGSQKGLMLPAGLAIVALSEKAIKAGQSAGLPRFFFDCSQMDQMTAAGGFPLHATHATYRRLATLARSAVS